MVAHSLSYYLSQIPDFRNKKGLKHPLEVVLSIVLQALVGGRRGLRSIARYGADNQSELIASMSLANGVPTFGTIRTVLLNVNHQALNNALFAWSNYHCPMVEAGYISADGKALASTIEDPNGSEQNYTSMISFYSPTKNMVYNSLITNSKKNYEPDSVLALLEELCPSVESADTVEDGTVVIDAMSFLSLLLRLDALHCKKKHLIL